MTENKNAEALGITPDQTVLMPDGEIIPTSDLINPGGGDAPVKKQAPVVIEKNPNIAEGTVMLSLELGRITNSRRLPSQTDAIETEADRKMLRVSVDLFDSKELKAVNKFLNTQVKKGVKAVTVPSFFRGGMYLVKHEAVDELDAQLDKWSKELEPLVEVFATVSEAQKEEARVRLGKAFDGTKYPTPEQIKGIFRIEWRWLTLETPDSLKKVSKAIWKREAEKAEAALATASEDITTLLAAEAKGLADHMVERLTPGEDGKRKVFHHTLVGNITEFLKNFSLRNMGSSTELDEQVKRMRSLLEGVDVKTLKENATLRDDISSGFAEVAGSLDTMVRVKPKRFIDLSKEG